ncbi:hypothetical protein EVAR_13159_1 [Eumeta japonica]|uniref:Uncharacterized protein n=1 Tax=Eumeta variegata TaxID=151549 RepID=A0A4C1UA02_EUMVA|nr:hypothetical protein EVAR_13159_1 [Eumeta japonica]
MFIHAAVALFAGERQSSMVIVKAPHRIVTECTARLFKSSTPIQCELRSFEARIISFIIYQLFCGFDCVDVDRTFE